MARIYYLSAATIPGKPAHTVQIMNMCAAMAEIGHEVTLFCKCPSGGAGNPFEYYGVKENFRVLSFPARQIRVLGSFLFYRDMSRALLEMPVPDILYARNPNAFVFLNKLPSSRVCEAHDLPMGPLVKFLGSKLYRHPGFRTQVAVNTALREDLLQNYPELPPEKCIVAPNGCAVPPALIEPIDLPGREAAPKIGYVGHLYPGKGMEVIAALTELVPEADFHIVGGMDGDIRYWSEKLKSDNVFFHGHVPAGQVRRYLKSMDVALVPIQREISHFKPGQDIGRYTSPLKILEYMAIGVPVVASDVAPVRELAAIGLEAWLVDPEKPEAWRDAIRSIQADRPRASTQAERAQREVLEHHTWPQRAEKILRHAISGE